MSYSINNIIFVSVDGNIGIGTNNPRCSLDLSQRTDAIVLPSGTTDQRLNLTNLLRFNNISNFMEFRTNNKWLSIVNVPTITAVYPNALKNANDIIDVSGQNLSTISQWSFIDTNGKEYSPKQFTFISSSHVQLKRPDVFPAVNAPYSIKVKQLGRFHIYGGITAGVIPSLSPGGVSLGTFLHNYNISSLNITATDESGGGITNISITTGVLPPGLSGVFTSNGINGTYTISGTPNTVVSTTTYPFTITATDAGYNSTSQNYSITIYKEFITGGTTLNYGDYHVRRFTTTGTLTVTSNIQVDLLLIGGGGGGAYGSDRTGGGGGAGGLIYDVNYSLAPGTYSYTIGNGGPNTTDGEYSEFQSYFAYGGGHGANSVYVTAGYGGSGGGAYHGDSNPGGGGGYGNELGINVPASYYNYGGGIGYNSGVANGYFRASGGGGAGSVGTTATSSVPGHGGVGLQNSITGTLVYYAGGGGGSAQSLNGQNAAAGNGGLGGGGAGAKATSTTAVTGGNATFYGGGGGGGASGGAGGTGYQGVLILRYKAVGPSITSPLPLNIGGSPGYSISYTFTGITNSTIIWSNTPTTFGTINPSTGFLSLKFNTMATGNLVITATDLVLGLTDTQTIPYNIY